MASIKFDNFLIDIAVHNVDGFLQKLLSVPIQNGFWVFLTVQNEHGKKEYFPSVDEQFRVKIYRSYADAIDDVARVLKQHFAA
ncbi:hypothetical protein [Pseudochryseolinea flava]|uniref:Uncharacterized protein n=1 Tax=Pseudochryseolinea flava TaxID=2059302 RepID=A0A364Y2X5_9BACT|nr:hypothetical protein [Pseudochryseolinea flava]RAW00126.1 hypothetical protein DQQ10_16390 [Pseudochryseolinea flava]